MNTLINAIENETNVTLTENLAITPKTTKSDLLDFFANGAALRNKNNEEVERFFSLAFSEDKLLALKCLCYIRDIRGGQGERKTFRTLLNYLGRNYPELTKKNLKNFIEYGRWDDLYSLLNTPTEEDVLKLIKTQLNKDIKAEEDNLSLLAKWLPSSNTSSNETRKQAYKTRSFLGLTEKEYRLTLSSLRKKIDIVERKMCSQKWNKINYSSVPSRATLIYRKAFAKHDSERYSKWQSDVEKGKKEIKASTLYPYDIVERAFSADNTDKTLDLQWKALPDYCENSPNKNGIVVADVSGSMSGRPMSVSISLAMYFAEKNKGAFKDYFITFTTSPELVKVKGDTIVEKVKNLQNANWGGNTNIQAVFDLILNTAIKNSVKQNEMPNVIYIVSDMQFDQATTSNSQSNFEVIKQKYQNNGYKMPKLVFWNVRASSGFPVIKDEINTVLVSGCSPVIFKTVLSGENPYQVMINTLNQKRYSLVKI